MKKLIVFLVAFFTAFSINAQINRMEKKELSTQTTNKPLTLKTTPPQTAQKPPSTNQPATPPAEKSLDLFLTNVTVTATKTGTNTYKMQIDYTIMNVDTAAIALGNFGVQGFAAVEGHPPFTAAGGKRAGLSYEILNPGAKVSGTFYAFNVQLSGTGRGVYDLGITAIPGFKIADQTKAGKRVYFTL
jgi:hypothetical protein